MLKTILQNQKVIIDDHRRGQNAIHDWNDRTAEVHIHKRRNSSEVKYDIWIPLNLNTPARVAFHDHDRTSRKLPRKLKKEIRDAFSDRNERARFFEDVYKQLAGYNWPYTEENANDVINRVANVFGFEATPPILTKEEDDRTISIVERFSNDDRRYLLVMNLIQNISSIGEFSLGLMRGVHAAAKNAWLIAVFNHLPVILSKETMVERLKELEKLAKNIKGIGKVTIDETHAIIEQIYYFDEQ